MPEPWEKYQDQENGPWTKYQKKPQGRPEPTEPPDPGFLAGTGRALRGVASGVESTVDEIGMRLPSFLQGANKPEEVRKELNKRPKPKGVEAGGEFVGEILPTLAVPELGAGRAAGVLMSRAPRTAQVLGSALEGGVRGGIGGAMMPGGDTTENMDVGTAAGAGVRGLGTAAQIGIGALPLKLKNTLSAIAAVAAANKMGMPWWAAFMHPDWGQKSLFGQLYNSNLADLAAKYFRGTTRLNPATVGGIAAEVDQGVKYKKQPQ